MWNGTIGLPVALGQPDRAGLRDARRPARAVDRERRRTAARPCRARSCASARAPPRDVDPRAALIAEPAHDPRDPLAVEILAGDRRRCRDRGSRAWRRESGRARTPGSAGGRRARRASKMLGAATRASGRCRRAPRRAACRCAAIAAALNALAASSRRHMPSYCGPSPPSGGTQSMIWYGSMMSHVLQCTQFDALICSFFAALARRRPSRRRSPDRTACTDCRIRRGTSCGRCRCRARSGATAGLRVTRAGVVHVRELVERQLRDRS